ncbi:MAG: mechanosensitive ion channel family protein, partial [Waterburya sp.]
LKAENDDILEPTQVEGIEEFGDIRLSIHTKTKVKPGKHLEVQRTLRKCLKQAFDQEGIYIPIGETTDKPDWATKLPQESGN